MVLLAARLQGPGREEPEQRALASVSRAAQTLSPIPTSHLGRSLSWSQGTPFLAQVELGVLEESDRVLTSPALTATGQDMALFSPHFLICNADNLT